MAIRHFILGTAGHIDHGKSSLIEALTGTDPDRLPEEKRRGMTIELGFAELELPTTDASGDKLVVGVIDVPGHSDFVKNMVAGVGAIDLALFIVAADDGWMPQTEEHYQILQYLGVDRAVIALTKADLVEDLELVLDDVRENLVGGAWETAPVIPVSSHTGQGLDDLIGTIAAILTTAPPVQNCGKPRLPVDRAFSLKGVGTVVTGTLLNGPLHTGTDLTVQPSGLTAHVRGIQSHGSPSAEVAPGTRTALDLTGVAVRDSRGPARDGVGRGDILTMTELGGSVTVIDVLLTKSARSVSGMRKSTRALRTGREVSFHHGSSGRAARLHLLGTKALEPGETVLAELRFREPVYVFVGDHFVLRDASAAVTLAGGIVLDEAANQRAFRKPFQATFLEQRRDATKDLDRLLRSQLERDKAAFLPSLLAKSSFAAGAIRARALELVAAGEFERSGDWVFEAKWWRRLSGMAGEKIKAVHRDHPDQLGMPLRDLRTAMVPELPSAKFFDVLLAGLLAGDYAKAGPNLRLRNHQPKLPPELIKAGELVKKRLGADPVNPPNKGETATNPAEEKALRFLLNAGEVIELDPKTVISSAGYERLKSQIIAFLKEHSKATASELRQHTGTVRRILMPLLERLDDEKITIRNGDDRTLAS